MRAHAAAKAERPLLITRERAARVADAAAATANGVALFLLAAEPETGLLTPAVLIGAVAVIVVVLCVGVMVCCTLCRKKRRRPENMYPASTVAWRDPTRQDSGRNSKAALNSGGFEMVSSSTRASSASNGNGGEPYGRTTLDRIRRKKNDGPAVVHISLQDSGGDTEMSDLRI